MPTDWLERKFCGGLFATEWLGSREGGGKFRTGEGEKELLPGSERACPCGKLRHSAGRCLRLNAESACLFDDGD